MPSGRLSRRNFLAGAVGASAALALPLRLDAAPAVKKGASLRLWILKTYVEPTNKAIEASAARWGEKHGASVTVEYFTFEDVQTKYVAAIENKNTPDVGQLETGAPARFAGMGQLLDLTTFSKQIEGEVGKPPANVAPVTIIGGKTYAHPLVHHAGLLVRVARRVREEQGEAARTPSRRPRPRPPRSPGPRTTSTAWARAGTAPPTATASCRA